ncbi:WD repeat-containing protein 13-like [Neocloeon triangulifer]|uniref:WD repeat-containing protein 13-like n=1 Tax=Neocloeon triangulifer TaxID=2078957 RepID=UPI00286EBB7D|nr:WD repeat-containing protein 13-like [Neocloeon triangulifer]
MTPSSWQQQAFAIDARVNALRASKHPNFRTQYLRRRSQLLRENAANSYDDDQSVQMERQAYLRTRVQLLQNRYGILCDLSSTRSVSARSSRISESPERRGSLSDWSLSESRVQRGDVVPTADAEASRAIVGGTTIEENYAFVGVHHIFDQHSAPVNMVKFANNDRSLLCCCSEDGTLSICNVTADPPCVVAILQGHSKAVTGCDWSSSNDFIASSSLDGSIRLWNVTAGQIPSCLRAITSCEAGTEILCCLFHPVNGNLLVTGNSKGVVQVVNVSTGINPKSGASKMGGRVQAIEFESSGQMLWAGNDKGVIFSFVLGPVNGRISKCRRLSLGDHCSVTCISWRAWCSREARDPTLLVNATNNSVYLFGVADSEGKLLLKRRFPIKHKELTVHSTFCPIMSFRQGVCVVSGSEDCCVYFFDIGNERSPCFNKLQGHSSPVLGISFNYDESLLASSDQQGLVILWKRVSRNSSSATSPTDC